ncbi:hypothetical protein I552_7157 [Mycobacterium xenopi 3993]|nr:hypothetical protein I552_7157 [Mycobacterium xenopi 3993]
MTSAFPSSTSSWPPRCSADHGQRLVGAGPGKLEQWTLLARARALDSTSYIAAADRPTRPDRFQSAAGRRRQPGGVPFGEVVASTGPNPRWWSPTSTSTPSRRPATPSPCCKIKQQSLRSIRQNRAGDQSARAAARGPVAMGPPEGEARPNNPGAAEAPTGQMPSDQQSEGERTEQVPGPAEPPPGAPAQPTLDYPAVPPPYPQEYPAAPPPGQPPSEATPAPVKTKRRLFRDPLSVVLVVVIVLALLIAGVIAAELYARHRADSVVAAATECVVQDKVSVSFGPTPFLLQHVTGNYGDISIHTAGNQIRGAKGMKADIRIDKVDLHGTADSKGTIGALEADVTWTSDGIKQTVADAVPFLGGLVNTVRTNPATAPSNCGARWDWAVSRSSPGGKQRAVAAGGQGDGAGHHGAARDRAIGIGHFCVDPDQRLSARHPRRQCESHQ